MKRILSLIFAAALVFSLIPLTAFAADTDAEPVGYAQVMGSDTRYWDGYTLYIRKGETLHVHFDVESADEGLIVGWRPEALREAGFTVPDDPDFIDGVTYAVIGTGDLTVEKSAALPYQFYRISDVFDAHGGMHWDTAVPIGGATLNVTMLPDDKPLCGDADGSGEVEIIDVTMIRREDAEIPTGIAPEVLMRGDADGSGEVDIIDATLIQRWLAYIDTPYPIGDPIADAPV